MATETEELAQSFRADTAEWNSTAEERESTREAMRESLQAIPGMVGATTASGADMGETAAGCLMFISEVLVLLIEQIGQLEERIAALEEER